MVKKIKSLAYRIILKIKKRFHHDRMTSISDYDDIPITTAIQSSIKLQNKLGLTENSYHRVAGYSHSDARAYYLYGVLDEVIKVATSLIKWRDFLSGEDKPPENEEDAHIRRLVIDAVTNEQKMWERKLVETLCNLICFLESNEQDYYRVLLLATNIDAYLGKQSDFNEFHGCNNENINHTLKYDTAWIKKLIKSLDANKLWFLKDEVKKPDHNYKYPGKVIASVRQRYIRALLLANEAEKLVLGVSYEEGYSTSSKSIHLSVGAPTISTELENVRVNMSHIGLLIPHIIIKCHELSGIDEEGLIKRVKNAISESNAKELMQSIHRRNHEIGDLVLAYGDFAEIIDQRVSKYGYHSYRVRYLSRPPVEEIPEEWFPAQYVNRIARKNLAKEFFKNNMPKSEAGKQAFQMIENMPDEKIYDCMRGILKKFADAGILVDILQRGAAERQHREQQQSNSRE